MQKLVLSFNSVFYSFITVGQRNIVSLIIILNKLVPQSLFGCLQCLFPDIFCFRS